MSWFFFSLQPTFSSIEIAHLSPAILHKSKSKKNVTVTNTRLGVVRLMRNFAKNSKINIINYTSESMSEAFQSRGLFNNNVVYRANMKFHWRSRRSHINFLPLCSRISLMQLCNSFSASGLLYTLNSIDCYFIICTNITSSLKPTTSFSFALKTKNREQF